MAKCLNCGNEFEAKRATARFDTPQCRAAFARKAKGGITIVSQGEVTETVDQLVPDGPGPVAENPIPVVSKSSQRRKKIMAEARPQLSEVEAKAQAALVSKEERLKRMNERLAARGLPLISDKPDPVQFIPTGIAALDALTANADEKLIGGFPRKHITEIFGPKGTGKTSLMKQVVQNTEGLNVLYIDAENGLINPPAWIDVSKATTVEAVEGLVFEGVQSQDYDLIIVDSVAVLSSIKELEESKAGMGAKPKAMAQFLRRVNAALRPIGPDGYPDPAAGTAVVFINQLRDTMNSFGTQEYTPGGRSIEYQASLRLELRSAKADLIADKTSKLNVGQKVRVRVEKSRFGPKDQTTNYRLMYGDIQ